MLFSVFSKKKNKNVYRLKTMASVRVVSEVAALIIFLCLPLVLLFAGVLANLDLVVKAAVLLGSIFALVMLPSYGFITWQITVTETGLIGWSLIKHRVLNWENLTKLTRKSNFNWQRYVLYFEGGDITFPLWFERQDQLIEAIREHLPLDLSPEHSGPRLFRQDTISFLMQFSQVAFGLVLSGVATYFAAYLFSSNKVSEWDAILVMGFVIILSLSVFYRAIVVALMPFKILVEQDSMELSTIFSKKRIPWSSIQTLTTSSPILPEGFMLESKDGSFLIGSGFDSLDELVKEMREKKLSVQD